MKICPLRMDNLNLNDSPIIAQYTITIVLHIFFVHAYRYFFPFFLLLFI